VGKFYEAFGGGKHPAQIYECDFEHQTYKSIKTGTTKRKGMICIHPIQKGKRSYVKDRPFEGVRKDYGDKELLGISFDPLDMPLIEQIKTRKTRKSKRAKLKYKKMPPSD